MREIETEADALDVLREIRDAYRPAMAKRTHALAVVKQAMRTAPAAVRVDLCRLQAETAIIHAVNARPALDVTNQLREAAEARGWKTAKAEAEELAGMLTP